MSLACEDLGRKQAPGYCACHRCDCTLQLLLLSISAAQKLSLDQTAGTLDAFFAACVDIQHSETQSSGPSRSSGVKRTVIKDIMSVLKLTREQLKDLSMLPFSSSLGLDDTFSQPKSQAPLDRKLLAAAKVCSSSIQIQPQFCHDLITSDVASWLMKRTSLSSLLAPLQQEYWHRPSGATETEVFEWAYQAGALRVQLASLAHDESDVTNPLSRTSAMAKAAADSDAAVRAAAAVLAPGFAYCSPKPRMVLQACVAMLLRLAGAFKAPFTRSSQMTHVPLFWEGVEGCAWRREEGRADCAQLDRHLEKQMVCFTAPPPTSAVYECA